MSHNGLRQVASKNANTKRPDPRKDSERRFTGKRPRTVAMPRRTHTWHYFARPAST